MSFLSLENTFTHFLWTEHAFIDNVCMRTCEHIITSQCKNHLEREDQHVISTAGEGQGREC